MMPLKILPSPLDCPSASKNHRFIVPYSNWIPVRPFLGTSEFQLPIPVATLVYYPAMRAMQTIQTIQSNISSVMDLNKKSVMDQDASPCHVSDNE